MFTPFADAGNAPVGIMFVSVQHPQTILGRFWKYDVTEIR